MSFETTHLDDMAGCQTLSYVEKDELEGWIQKFKYYRCYPVKGRLVADADLPDPNHVVSEEELTKNNGDGEVPDKYAAAPIYLGAGDKGMQIDTSIIRTNEAMKSFVLLTLSLSTIKFMMFLLEEFLSTGKAVHTTHLLAGMPLEHWR